MQKLKLYGTPLSGHVHRVALLLRMLALPYEFIEAGAEVRYGPASSRLIAQFSAPEDYQSALAVAARFLPHMEQHLANRAFLATDEATIGDLACYSYVAVAPEGGISLAPYPAIQRWVARIAALPGFFAMPTLPEPGKR
ncbi:glutathione binding-like protein [Serratia grimesii]|uniref:glutathione binding-like protein n=1 Tax=Serratia grimesii TaxID=82995 RepID=UPI00383B5613